MGGGDSRNVDGGLLRHQQMVPLVVDLVKGHFILLLQRCCWDQGQTFRPKFLALAGGRGAVSRYLHPCQHWTTVDLVVSDGREAGEVGGQHRGHRLEHKNGVSPSFPS